MLGKWNHTAYDLLSWAFLVGPKAPEVHLSGVGTSGHHFLLLVAFHGAAVSVCFTIHQVGCFSCVIFAC